MQEASALKLRFIEKGYDLMELTLPSNRPSKGFYKITGMYCVMIGFWDFLFQLPAVVFRGALPSDLRSHQM